MTDPNDEILAIRVAMLPRDTNAHGTIFGGHIMSLIDQAGAVAAHARGAERIVTVAMHEVEFKQPVYVGDMVTCYARVLSVGRTSITVHVRVTAQSPLSAARDAESRLVTTADVVYVQVDERGQPIALARSARPAP